MSMRIAGLSAVTPTAVRKPEPARERPAGAPPAGQRGPSPPAEADRRAVEVAAASPPAPTPGDNAATEGDSGTAALESAERVAAAAAQAPREAARAHANLIGATVLNLLA